MRRVLLLLVLPGLAFVGARWLWRSLSSDETKIRRVIGEMQAAFGDTDTSGFLQGLAPAYRDDTSGLERDEVRQALVALFFQAKDPETKRFPYRVELPEQDFRVELLDGKPAAARVELLARFHELHRGQEQPVWDLRVVARLEEGQDGWQIVRTQHETLSGDGRLDRRARSR